MTKLRIFIASPGDVSEERDIIANVVIPELRRVFSDQHLLGNKRPIEIEAVRWETHAWPDIGEDAQDVINREIGDYDLLVGIMWRRYGTPTKRSGSGTGEEFDRAYQYYKAYKRPKIMFYFRASPFYTTSSSDWTQFQKVVKFRTKLEKLGVLFWEYSSPLDFERDVREHLIRQIIQLVRPAKETPPGRYKNAAKGKGGNQKKPKLVQRSTEKIFFLYAREDLDIVKPIYYAVKEAGFQPWLDVEALLPGQNWLFQIDKAIRETDVVLAFLSNSSLNKRGFFQKEIRMAIEKMNELMDDEIYLIPVRLEPIMVPDQFIQFQWVDYFAEGGPEQLMLALKVAAKKHQKSVIR